MEWLEGESQRLARHGKSSLVAEFVRLQPLNRFPHLEQFLAGLQELHQRCEARGEAAFGYLTRYFIGRTLGFPLDRPGAAIDGLMPLQVELMQSSLRGGILHRLVELELYRAYHKRDAPGHLDVLRRGLEQLWESFAGDPGPRLEILDIFWRTGFWCRRPEIMYDGLRLAQEEARLIAVTWPFWHGRALHLQGELAEAIQVLEDILRRADEALADDLWLHYVEVELASVEASLGQANLGRSRLEKIEAPVASSADPMLQWDFHRVRARLHELDGRWAEAVAAWTAAVRVVRHHGLLRLQAEFALALRAAARQAGRGEDVARAQTYVGEVWGQLRSRDDLEAEHGR